MHSHLGFLASQLARVVRGRTAVVMDASNLHLSAPNRDIRLDFGAVRTHFGGATTDEAHAVLSLPPVGVPVPHGRRAMIERLTGLGWTTHVFNALPTDPDGDAAWHEDEAAVDGQVRSLIRQHARRNGCDNIVVLSGDGGMASAVRYARRLGKRVVVGAWAGAINPALAAACNKFVLLDSFYALLRYQPRLAEELRP